MRVRISRLEAEFILETIATRKQEIGAILERCDQLEKEVFKRRVEIFQVGNHSALKGFKQLKDELEELEREKYRLNYMIRCFDVLTQKFQIIRDGLIHKGRYPSRATGEPWQYRRASNKPESL